MGFKALGINVAATKYAAEFYAKRQFKKIKNTAVYLLAVQLIIFGLFTLITVYFADHLASHYFKSTIAARMLVIVAIAFLLSILETVFASLFNGLQRPLHYAAVDVIGNATILIFAAALFWWGTGAMTPAYAYLLSFAITPIIFFILLWKRFPEIVLAPTSYDPKLLKKLLTYGVPLMVALIGTSITGYFATITLTYFKSLTEVGIYNAALPIAGLLRYFAKATSTVIMPLSSELQTIKHPKFGIGVTRLQKYLVLLIIPFVASVYCFPDTILGIFFGKEYISGARALQILSIGIIPLTVALVNTNILLGIGKAAQNATCIMIGAITALILTLIFVPRFGIEGAAIAATISNVTMFFYSEVKVRTGVGNKVPYRAWIKGTIGGIMFISVISNLSGRMPLPAWAEAALLCMAATGAYFGLLLLMRALTVKEIKRILTIAFSDKEKYIVRKQVT